MLAILALAFGLPSASLAEEDTWTYKADMPTARGVLSGCVLDGKIYVVGGAPSSSSVTSAVEMYHPIVDTWTKMANMPSARCAHAACTFDGKIYVFGGISPAVYSTAKKNVYVYDPQIDTWTQKADMPYANALCGIAVVDGIIYLIGGSLSVSSPPIPTVMAYDPMTESWTQKADMPTARFWLSTSVVDGKIYAIGGCTENWGVFSYEHVEVYDPSTNTWTRPSDMPTARFGLGTCVVGEKIYAIGGHLPTGATTANEVYDSITDTWTTKSPMQHKRLGHVLGLVRDKIYAIGGSYPNPGPTVLSSVEEYETGLGVPPPDFNGDEIVDFKDFSILAQYWCLEQSPFVNHRVDYEYLAVLADYWLKEVLPDSLLAYWKLDETEGMLAYDSAGDKDGSLNGDPVWQPTAGKVDGALQLDGTGDYVSTPFVLNPGDGKFSVFAWTKGGQAGQVIIGQANGANWLAADSSEGWLITSLKGTGRFGSSLGSQTVITDDNWHRVGLTWDGSTRILYVDDVEVAKDTQAGLVGSQGGLYIGAGKVLEPGSFFSGLIDDVRIYDRAVSP